MEKSKTAEELINSYKEILALDKIDDYTTLTKETRREIIDSFPAAAETALSNVFKTQGTDSAKEFINKIRDSLGTNNPLGLKLQEQLGKLQIDKAKTGKDTIQTLGSAIEQLKNDPDFKNLSPSEQTDAVNRLTSAAEDRMISLAREIAGKGDSDQNVNAINELRNTIKYDGYGFSEQKINELENVYKKADQRNESLKEYNKESELAVRASEKIAESRNGKIILSDKKIKNVQEEQKKLDNLPKTVADSVKFSKDGMLKERVKILADAEANRIELASKERELQSAVSEIAKRVSESQVAAKLQTPDFPYSPGAYADNLNKELSGLAKESFLKNGQINEEKIQRLFPEKEVNAVRELMKENGKVFADEVHKKLGSTLIEEAKGIIANDSRFSEFRVLDPNSAGYKNLIVSIALEKKFNDKGVESLLAKQKDIQSQKTALENKMKTMFQTDKNNKLILVNGEPVLDQTKMNKAIADELKSRQAEMQKRIDNLKIVAMADKKIRELQAIKNPDDSQKSDLKFWTDMKNQYDFSPSNVSAVDLKKTFLEEKVKVIDAMKSFPDVKIGTDYKLSGSKNDIEKVLSKLEKDLPNNPHVAKLMAMNTYETIPDPKFGSVHQVTVYGQKILLQVNDDNKLEKIGNTNAQVWLNTANAIKESGLDTVIISAVNYKPVGEATHGKGEALDILYVRQGGKDIRIDIGDYTKTGYPDYPEAVRAFDNAYINQPGSAHIWNPWTMYYGGTETNQQDKQKGPATNKAIDWIKSEHWEKIKGYLATKDNDGLNAFLIKHPELKPPGTNLPEHQDWGHTTHGHYNTDPAYDNLRNF